MKHELVRLTQAISWPAIEASCGEAYRGGPGMPPLLTQLMAGLAILKHTFNLSDEEVCARWVENPYFQYFCGEEIFFARVAVRSLLDGQVAPAHRRGADRRAIAEETCRLRCGRAPWRPRIRAGLEVRQSYTRVGKLALIKHQRYAYAKQLKRAGKALRKLKTYLGRQPRHWPADCR